MSKNTHNANLTAVFINKGSIPNFKTNRILLKNVKTEHDLIIFKEIWVNETKAFKEVGNLRYGDIISFQASYDTIDIDSNSKVKRSLSKIKNVTILPEVSINKSSMDNYNSELDALLNQIIKKDID